MIVLALLGCGQLYWPETPPADPCAAEPLPEGEYVVQVVVGDKTRQALVWMPGGSGPHDVIVSLHEHNAEPRRQAHYAGWVDVGRERDAIVIGPDGKTATWNAGDCCGKARNRNITDGPFLDAVVAKVEASTCTTGRVVATGIGAGGMMAHRWACESDVPDAVLSVGGALQMPSCAATRPIPMVHYHGADDQWMPMDGSGGHMTLGHALEHWVARNHATKTTTFGSPDLACRRWDGDAPVVSCIVAMSDEWPGATGARVQGPDGPYHASRDGMAIIDAAWDAAP